MNQKIKSLLGSIVVLFLFFSVAGSVNAQSFTFGAAGDFAFGSNFRATVGAARAQNLDFTLALGDFSYNTDDQGWCNYWINQGVPNVVPIVGNHDSGESSGGNINNIVTYCPFRLPTQIVGTYGKEYYFDYPPGAPIARFILIAPGVRGSYMSGFNTNYSPGQPGYTFTSNAIDDARAKGISWVIVGFHKNCISALEKSCEVGTSIMQLLISKRVDLILQGHEHGYERSKQLSCITTNSYNASCVVDSDNELTKGLGSIVHVIGTGGQGLRGLNTNDSEYPYFAALDNTTYGLGRFSVDPTTLRFDFVRSAGGNFSDGFTIGSSIAPPTPTPPSTPTPVPTISPTKTPSPTPKPTVAPSPTLTPSPIPSSTPSPTNCTEQIPASASYIENTVVLPEQGNYTFWGRIKGETADSDSFWLQIDDRCPIVVGDQVATSSEWQWLNYQDGKPGNKIVIPFAAGVSYKVKIASREESLKVDRIIFDNKDCIPNNLGDNCTQAVTPTFTPSPSPMPTISPSGTPSPTIIPLPGDIQGISPTDDTFVRPDRATSNYGSSRSIEVDGSPAKIGLLKFDLRSLSQPVNKATLRLRVIDSSGSTQNVHMAENNWAEATVNYNTMPKLGSTFTSFKGGSSGNWIEIDVTNAVNTSLGNDLTIAMDSSGSNGIDYNSKEASADRPQLVLNTSDTPGATPSPAPSPTPAPTATGTPVPSPTSSPTPAPTATPAPTPPVTPDNLLPTDDSYVNEDSPGSNYGGKSTLEVDGESRKIVYLKFDLSSVNKSALQNATLRLRVVDSSGDTRLVRLLASNDWSEGSINYQNRPTFSDSTVITQLGGADSGSNVNIDLTSIIKNSPANTITITLDQSGSNGMDFASKENGSNPPTLLLTY